MNRLSLSYNNDFEQNDNNYLLIPLNILACGFEVLIELMQFFIDLKNKEDNKFDEQYINYFNYLILDNETQNEFSLN